MKKRYIGIGLVLCLLILVALFGPKLYQAVRVWQIADGFLSAQTGSMDISLDIAGAENSMEFRLDWQETGGKRVYILSAGGVSVYCCEGTVYLENGKGYAFGDGIPDVSGYLEKPWLMYPLVKIDREEDAWLVELDDAACRLTLRESEGKLRELYVYVHAAALDVDNLNAYAVVKDRDVPEIPTAVLDAIESGNVQSGGDLTENMLRLLKGWGQLNARDPLAMELALSADCGVLSLHDTLNVYMTMVEGTAIRYVEKPGLGGLYFTDRAVCSAEGKLITTQDSSVEAAQLLGLAYQLCFNGELECQGDVFRLTLDQTGMESVAYAIAPQARELNIDLTSGVLELTMQDDTIERIRFECAGVIDLLLTQVDASIGAELTFTQSQTQFTIPQAVVDALTQ